MNKAIKIFYNSIPVLIMIGLIPFIQNDYILTLCYILISALMFLISKMTKNEALVYVFGFIIMIFSEYIFISTGVEVFMRNSLFGLMPLWLPFLWAYGFVVISRCIKILDNK